jgi:hypothetical protein
MRGLPKEPTVSHTPMNLMFAYSSTAYVFLNKVASISLG